MMVPIKPPKTQIQSSEPQSLVVKFLIRRQPSQMKGASTIKSKACSKKTTKPADKV